MDIDPRDRLCTRYSFKKIAFSVFTKNTAFLKFVNSFDSLLESSYIKKIFASHRPFETIKYGAFTRKNHISNKRKTRRLRESSITFPFTFLPSIGRTVRPFRKNLGVGQKTDASFASFARSVTREWEEQLVPGIGLKTRSANWKQKDERGRR